ncbi:MAG: formylglycine-generating enzyme family protein [Thermodesulfobacteriota bacterium]
MSAKPDDTGAQIRLHSTLPDSFPAPWASDWGEDRYGRLWMAFTFQGVRQVLRWIRPGSFQMGSPPNEPERFKNEEQHEVILTRGFWLADTACSQRLWQAVMGENPSRFKGEARPVERVGWEDCQAFLARINEQVPGLELRLPSEAEWEYACRAGTTTPFSFGTTITPDQVNYDGNHPYAGDRKGLYRQETVDVKSLPANPWGLYEMHGNVWEWCADWYGEYSAATVVDPVGPFTGTGRVLRGGSWSTAPGGAVPPTGTGSPPPTATATAASALPEVNDRPGRQGGRWRPGRTDAAEPRRSGPAAAGAASRLQPRPGARPAARQRPGLLLPCDHRMERPSTFLSGLHHASSR